MIILEEGMRLAPFAPRCRSWRGHKFEARYSIQTPSSFSVESAPADVVAGIIEASTRLIYVHDICVRCGHVVAPTSSNEGVAA